MKKSEPKRKIFDAVELLTEEKPAGDQTDQGA